MNATERKFLLAVEKGEIETVKELLESNDLDWDINCCDPLARNGLVIAIYNQNLELVKILTEAGIVIDDGILYAIDENFIEAVEFLLDHEEATHKPGMPHSWEQERDNSPYSNDMTPLILAAHRDNFEILKILLDRGTEPIPRPHDPNCHCLSCCDARSEDCLMHSRSRINAYQALASPCLIALSSPDPLLTAFELSSKLESLSKAEPEYQKLYLKLRTQCQLFATKLLDHTRTSKELEILLNYSEDIVNEQRKPSLMSLDSVTGRYETYKSDMRLARLRMAIDCKQKTFCAHPNIQELLATMWYENLPGFRNKSLWAQSLQIIFIGLMFPIYSIAYLVAPHSQLGRFIKKPFIKFICHSASYMTFLIVLILASQRVEAFYSWDSVLRLFGEEQAIGVGGIGGASTTQHIRMEANFSIRQPRSLGSTNYDDPELDQIASMYRRNAHKQPASSARSFEVLDRMLLQLPLSSKKRGTLPSPIELVILLWVVSLLWAELKQLRSLGINYYRADMWNTLDSVALAFYVGTIFLRIISYIQCDDEAADLAREHWDAYDPILLGEALFAAATIFSALKLVYIFSLNPYLGPLQISLGRMIIDIFSFSWIYMLVLFSFACGMNQLLWYYADLERHQCLNITHYSLANYYGANENHHENRIVNLVVNNGRSNQSIVGENETQIILIENSTTLASSGGSSSTPLPPKIQNVSEENLMKTAFDISLEDEPTKPPVTLDPSCKTWRYFANVFEASQTLFWATFGLVDLENFDLTGIQKYTRFWALLMFGCYCFINVVVVINLLIAMMNHSYVKISQKSDIEWKFARTRLWMSYFDTGSTVPAPFNIVPSLKSVKHLFYFLRHFRVYNHHNHNEHQNKQANTTKQLEIELNSSDKTLTTSYKTVIKALVRRYLVSEQRKVERDLSLTEAKLTRWARMNAFD